MACYFERDEEKKFAEETVATALDMEWFNTQAYKQNARIKC